MLVIINLPEMLNIGDSAVMKLGRTDVSVTPCCLEMFFSTENNIKLKKKQIDQPPPHTHTYTHTCTLASDLSS